jgi:hypothetical protein
MPAHRRRRIHFRTAMRAGYSCNGTGIAIVTLRLRGLEPHSGNCGNDAASPGQSRRRPAAASTDPTGQIEDGEEVAWG